MPDLARVKRQCFLTIVLLPLTTGLATLRAEFVLIKTANSADLNAGVPRGGALATILCSGLPVRPGLWKAPESGPLPSKLAGIEVLINGALSPMISVFIPTTEQAAAGAEERIDFQVPLERNATIPRDGPLDVPLPLIRAGGKILGGHVYFYPGPAPYPGAWFRDSAGYVIAEHISDGSRVTPENPARPGETITVHANDFYPWGTPKTGQ